MHAPFPVHRPVEQLNAALVQFGTYRILVVDPDRELKARAGFLVGDRGRGNQTGRLGDLQQIDDCIA